VIVGSSVGALIGLQSVVIIADMPIARGQAQAGDAFATPTIVHFGAAPLGCPLLPALLPTPPYCIKALPACQTRARIFLHASLATVRPKS
jgi:hypothetical protein